MLRILVLGDINLDVLCNVPASLPMDGELRTDIVLQPGGAAANFARVAVHQGAEVELVGCVGDDLSGRILAESLSKEGVVTHLQRSNKQSGSVISLNSPQGKTMLCCRGANDMLESSFVEDRWFSKLDHVHVSGYSLLSKSQADVTKRVADMALSKGIKISIDPPPANLISSFGAKHFLSDIKKVWAVFPNLAEARQMTDKDSPEEMVEDLCRLFSVGAVTMGREGSIAWAGEKRSCMRPQAVIDADATGAGDAFAAGFIISYLERGDLEMANRQGMIASLDLLMKRSSLRKA